jgi:hypothetical protein
MKTNPNSCQKPRPKPFIKRLPNSYFSVNKIGETKKTISFLTTRVKLPDEDDWGKLKRVLKYLNGTRHMKLNLSADNITCLKWRVDTSHATHKDCRGHTGAMLSLGKGAVISISYKHKINTKSSTEGELVGVNDVLPGAVDAIFP